MKTAGCHPLGLTGHVHRVRGLKGSRPGPYCGALVRAPPAPHFYAVAAHHVKADSCRAGRGLWSVRRAGCGRCRHRLRPPTVSGCRRQIVEPSRRDNRFRCPERQLPSLKTFAASLCRCRSLESSGVAAYRSGAEKFRIVSEAGYADGMERRRYKLWCLFLGMPIGTRCFAPAHRSSRHESIFVSAVAFARETGVLKASGSDAAWPGTGESMKHLSVQVANPDGCSDQIRRARVTSRWRGSGYRSPARLEDPAPTSPSQTVGSGRRLLVSPFVYVTGEQSAFRCGPGSPNNLCRLWRCRAFRCLPSRAGARTLPMCCPGVSRKAGARVRISAQLVSSATGTHVWARLRISTTISSRCQDELAASRQRGARTVSLLRSAAARPSRDRSARDLVRQGTLLCIGSLRDTP